MEYPDVQMHMATAKRGTWQKLGDTAKALARLVYNSLTCDFSTATDGGYFLIAEGINTGYEMILVAPDGGLDFPYMMTLDFVSALRYVSSRVSATPFPGWQHFITWFDNNMSSYGWAVQAVSILGRNVGTVPSYTNTSHSQSVFFNWLADCADSAGCSDVTTGTLAVSDNKISVPVLVQAADRTLSMTIQMAI